MAPIISSDELKRFNEAQCKEMKKHCKTDAELIKWINKNSQNFREKFYMNKKSWYSSKTIIFNILSISILLIQHFADSKVIDPEYAAIAITVINIIIRKFTSKSI